MRKIDLLMALTGGSPTIELEDPDRTIEEIEPRVTVPMRYRIPKLGMDILALEAFLRLALRETR